LKLKKHIVLGLLLGLTSWCYAQQISVKLGNTTIVETEFFTITLTVNNGKLNTYSNFPEINGFSKYTTISNATNAADKLVKPLIITQQYTPLKTGKFKINDFTMNINGVIIPVKGSNIVVTADEQLSEQKNKEALENEKKIRQYKLPEELLSLKEPFLTLLSNKSNVYVGEAITVTLLFCIPEGNKTVLKFHELGPQLSEIVKKIKPENCTQQSVALDSIQQGTLTQGNKKYSYFKLYETFFYPINDKKILIPTLSLTLQASKKAFGKEEEMKPSLVNFSSKQILIDIKPLPPHPLKDIVSVGNYQLKETISTIKLKTGKSFTYIFTLEGEGNINQISKPKWPNSPNFEMFDPEIKKTTFQEKDKLMGTCAFNYFIIPHEPGVFGMKHFFNYIYFNSDKQKYDTLSSSLMLHVYGESKHNLGVSLNSGDGFYDLIASENNFFINKNTKEVYILLAKVFILVLVAFLLLLMIRR
jgi:hypothetical protein